MVIDKEKDRRKSEREGYKGNRYIEEDKEGRKNEREEKREKGRWKGLENR